MQIQAPESRKPPSWHAALLVLLPALLVAGCWNADFIAYDDAMLVVNNALLRGEWSDVFRTYSNYPYFPITLASYRLDILLFESWMPDALGSWAPGIRLMNLLYHIGATLFLWRFFLLLRVGPGPALFVAAVFGVHPAACETVCWAAERKNVLPALFGFAALWAHLRFEGRFLRVPLVLALFALALTSKASALGFLPVFVFLELIGGPAGLSGERPMQLRPSRAWLAMFERLLPFGLASLALVVVSVDSSGHNITPPPGGGIFTALLTDLEVLARYIFNLVLPVQLSAVYLVEPVLSPADWRVAGFGVLLALLVAASVALAQNRRRAAFGWLWFFGALGPHLNLIAIPFWMQDRYMYLALPGLFLALAEAAAGLRARIVRIRRTACELPLSSQERGPGGEVGIPAQAASRGLMVAAGLYLVLLAGLALERSFVWRDTYSIFADAVKKQPRAAYARYGLGTVFGELWNREQDPALSAKYKSAWLNEWQAGLDKCPDRGRYTQHLEMALELGNEFDRRAGSPLITRAADREALTAAAEHYWNIAAFPPPETSDNPRLRAQALSSLALLKLSRKDSAEALRLASAALEASDTNFTRALAALARAPSAGAERRNLIAQARADLAAIQPDERRSFPKRYAEALRELEILLRGE